MEKDAKQIGEIISEILQTLNVNVPINYEDWHRNRDKMARDQRNFEVHKKIFGW